MQDLKGSQRKKLRSFGHHLDPVVMIGKNGLTDAVIRKIDDALESHELIKIKFVEFKEEKETIVKNISEKGLCHSIGITGHTALFYRQQKDPEKRKYDL